MHDCFFHLFSCQACKIQVIVAVKSSLVHNSSGKVHQKTSRSPWGRFVCPKKRSSPVTLGYLNFTGKLSISRVNLAFHVPITRNHALHFFWKKKVPQNLMILSLGLDWVNQVCSIPLESLGPMINNICSGILVELVLVCVQHDPNKHE